ncbi:Uncharacterized protein SCG7109_BU_00020 [Chlamydiales bacterium SCGC AG-110-M15]|nr:Uncharacterized protein SCG7109_BU_00020 [Chlamydiales bacterium SCGC AG-110-M15]
MTTLSMNLPYFMTALSILVVIYFILGYLSSRDLKDNHDYFLAGKDLGLPSVFFTLIATQIGGGMILGTSEEAYQSGIYGILYSLGMCLGFIALGLGLGARLRNLNVSTVAEIFEKKYKSKQLKSFASFLSIISMFGIFVAQVVASRRFMLGLGMESELFFLFFWGFVIAYTVIGGLKAVVVTDTLQVGLVILIFTGVFITHSAGHNFSDYIANIGPFDEPSLSWTGLLIMPMCFSVIEQDIAQRCFSARTPNTARNAAFLSGLFIFAFSFVPVFFGMLTRISGIDIPEGASPLIVYLQQSTGEFVFVLIVCGLLAAITSTADSLLCAISSNLAQDFSFEFIGLKRSLGLSQMITLILGILGLIVAYFFNNILALLIQSYELPVSCLFVSVLYSLFTDKLDKRAASASVIVGLLSYIVFHVYTPKFMPPEILTLGFSFVAYFIPHSLLDKKSLNV